MEGHRWFFICVLVFGVVDVLSHQPGPSDGDNKNDPTLSNGAGPQGDDSQDIPSILSLHGRIKRHALNDKDLAKLGKTQEKYMSKGYTKEEAFDKTKKKYPIESKDIYDPRSPGAGKSENKQNKQNKENKDNKKAKG